MSDAVRNIVLNVRTTRDEGPKRSTERVDELGDHLTKLAARSKLAEKALGGLNRKLLSTAGAATVAGKSLKNVGDGGKHLERVMFKVHKTMQALGGVLQKFLVGGLKMATMSLGAMSIALVGVHALFVVGKFLIKSYHVALKGLAAGAAGAAVAIGLVSAAIREQQAAQFAYAGRGNKEFGTGLRQAQVHMRSLHADTSLAGAGAEALNKAYAEIAKSTTGFDNRSKGILKGLGDFASAGQPLEEGLQKAAAVVVALQDKKKGFGAVTAAAKEMGPAMVKALDEAKKKGIDTKEEFLKALNDGTLSSLGGVTGQMDAVNNTLMGQMKKYFNLIRVQFADFGQQFLPEAKVGLERIYKIFTRTMAETSGAITGWEKRGGFVDALVNAVQKVSDFYVKLIRDYLPKSEGMFSRLGAWWDKFKTGWRNVTESLRPLIDGARVIESSFGKAWRPIWNEIKTRGNEFNRDLQKNKPAFEEFGATIGNTIAQMIKMLHMFEKVITNNLPFISRVVKALGNMVEQFMSMFGFLSKIFGDRGAFMALMGMARGLKTTRGTLVERDVNTQNMNVKANSVSLMGTIKGAYDGYKLGKFGGPKGAAIGAVAGGLAGGGWLGGRVKEKWDDTAGRAARVMSLKGLLGGGKALAAAVPSGSAAASTAGTASSSLLGLRSAGTSASTAVTGLGTASDKSTRGLGHFNKALGRATGSLMRLRSSGGGTPTTPATTPTTPTPVTKPTPPAPGITPKGSPRGTRNQFSRVFRGMSALGGYGKQHKDKADRDARQGRKPFGGMGSFVLGMGLANLSDRVQDENVAAGLSLAASAAMFSPKLGLGIGAGTLAMNSEDGGLAMLGGAGAGALVGSEFGATGAVIGAVIGTIAGYVMAPITAMKKAQKEAEVVVKDFFAKTTGEIMVNMALMEAQNKMLLGDKGGDTTIVQSMDAAAKRMDKLNKIAAKGAKGGMGPKSRGYMETVLGATALGTGIGAISGGGLFSAGTAAVGAGVGFISGNIAYGIGRLNQGFGRRGKRDEARGEAINELYAAGMISKSQYERATGKKKNKFLGIDRLAGDEAVDSRYQQALLEQVEKQSAAYAKAYESASATVDSRIDVIKSVTGMAETEIVSLAQTMNVNLADATADFNQQLLKLGVTVVKTAEQLDQSIASMMQNVIEQTYSSAIKQEQAPHIINDIMKNFRVDYDTRSDKSISVADSQQIFGTAAEQLTNLYGGDASLAYFAMMEQFGSPEGLAFQEINPLTGKRNPLGGLGQQFYSGMAGQANVAAIQRMEKGMIDIAVPQLGAIMARGGQGFVDSQTMNTIKTRVADLSVNDQKMFFDALSTGNLDQFGGIQGLLGRFGMGDLATSGNLKTLTENQKAFGMAEDNLSKEAVLLEAQLKVTEDMGKFFGEGADKPEWWSADSLRQLFTDAGLIEDTRTPRGKGIGDTTSSRLSKTLSRHAAMDSMISGKRMITSSYRTNNLGSLNSDHITGRAYDLVGNQLGMYKTTVERNGGFAEYHGRGENRHLHVVPGAVGDTTVPSYSRAMQPIGATSSENGVASRETTINVNVNGIGIKEAIPQIQAALQRAMYESRNRS